MPELPEVETIKETLKRQILGKTIASVETRYDKIIKHLSSDEFASKLTGQSFRNIRRKGKYLFFDLDDYTLVTHLRMEGKFFLKPESSPIEKHEHIIFHFTDKTTMRYDDMRKFGTMQLVGFGREIMADGVEKLGLEPFAEAFTSAYLREKLHNSKTPIKSALLDQTVVSGLGNIYVDEVLFRSRIYPKRPAGNLSMREMDAIVCNSRTVLDKAIELGGSTIRSYVSSLGVTGRFQNELMVHTREGEPCHICKTTIEKTKVGGRGTYFCPHCQMAEQVPMEVIGLTGGIASGKSLISGWFKEEGIPVIDADFVYKRLTKPHEVLYNEIVGNMPDVSLCPDESIDWQKLAHKIYSDDSVRQKLNALSHPVVIEEILKELDAYDEKGEPLVVVSAPLLYESGFERVCDVVIVVDALESVRIERLMERDHIDKDYALSKIGSQMSSENRKGKADYVIDNSGSIDKTKRDFQAILQSIMRK